MDSFSPYILEPVCQVTIAWSVEEVAELLKASPRAVRKWLQQGKLPGQRVGRFWFVPEDALLAHLGGKGASNGNRD